MLGAPAAEETAQELQVWLTAKKNITDDTRGHRLKDHPWALGRWKRGVLEWEAGIFKFGENLFFACFWLIVSFFSTVVSLPSTDLAPRIRFKTSSAILAVEQWLQYLLTIAVKLPQIPDPAVGHRLLAIAHAGNHSAGGQ